jgi:general secretion pathway protein A
MYEKFFNFREKPFKLVPNPDYLFLSTSHEETLAHLNYALAEGDGFVEIIGEVGTGKTTLCRTFLESLDPNTIAAYIFNPMLGPRQLIRTINDELGIKYDADNTKDLIDNLNSFLMRKKAQRKKAILLIDEAQNLSRNVLEQLRLLSNLETNQEKLLQIILVGQPELSEILDSHELRQLSQRITLRYHLSPLNQKETVEYIRYRLNIAAQNPAIKFNRSAFRQIYKYSRGIPRVINIACDRSLLTAFGLSRHKITGSIARASIKELMGARSAGKFNLVDLKNVFIIFAVLGLVLTAAIFHQPLTLAISEFFNHQQNPEFRDDVVGKPSSKEAEVYNTNEVDVYDPDNSQVSDPNISGVTSLAEPEPSVADISEHSEQNPPSDQQESVVPEPAPEQKETVKLADYLKAMDIRSSRHTALENAMELWQTPIEFKPYLNSLDDDHAFFRLTAKPSGIFIHRIESNLDLLKRLDLPAILEFYPQDSEKPGYLTLSEADGDKVRFDVPKENKEIETNEDEINLYWSGVAYLPWKNFLSIEGTLPARTNKDSIITLKLLLYELGYQNVELNSDYDIRTRNAIEEIQTRYGILADGYVGPLTKIILYKSKGSFEMPRLNKES